jgi:hypothetical protein
MHLHAVLQPSMVVGGEGAHPEAALRSLDSRRMRMPPSPAAADTAIGHSYACDAYHVGGSRWQFRHGRAAVSGPGVSDASGRESDPLRGNVARNGTRHPEETQPCPTRLCRRLPPRAVLDRSRPRSLSAARHFAELAHLTFARRPTRVPQRGPPAAVWVEPRSGRFHQPPPNAWNSAALSARRLACAWTTLLSAC